MVRRLHNVGLMASDETRAVLFDIAGDKITISASSDNGQGKSVLDSVIEGGDACIKFNYSFIIDALKNMSDEKAVLQYKDSENPARFDDGDFMYVIMPINK
jgi:DNA polymerase III sliding clamp (beta) subunit (PCNA family)